MPPSSGCTIGANEVFGEFRRFFLEQVVVCSHLPMWRFCHRTIPFAVFPVCLVIETTAKCSRRCMISSMR